MSKNDLILLYESMPNIRVIKERVDTIDQKIAHYKSSALPVNQEKAKILSQINGLVKQGFHKDHPLILNLIKRYKAMGR